MHEGNSSFMACIEDDFREKEAEENLYTCSLHLQSSSPAFPDHLSTIERFLFWRQNCIHI